MNLNLKGTGVAIVTPFNEDESIDYKAFKNLIEYQISNNIDYLVVLGTTGESATMDYEEKQQLIRTAIETANKRVPIVIGLGGNNTKAVVKQLQQLDIRGIDAILSVSPFYNKPIQEGIYQHYKQIAIHSPLPVIIYNVPGRTGANIKAETTLRLANDFDKFIAIKEASGDMNQIMTIIKHKPKDFMLISGDDALTYPIMTLGGEGVISVVANAYPKDFSEMVRCALNGKIEEAKRLHYKLLDFSNIIFSEGSPGGIKAALEIMGLCKNRMRLPVVPVSTSTYQAIQKTIKNY